MTLNVIVPSLIIAAWKSLLSDVCAGALHQSSVPRACWQRDIAVWSSQWKFNILWSRRPVPSNDLTGVEGRRQETEEAICCVQFWWLTCWTEGFASIVFAEWLSEHITIIVICLLNCLFCLILKLRWVISWIYLLHCWLYCRLYQFILQHLWHVFKFDISAMFLKSDRYILCILLHPLLHTSSTHYCVLVSTYLSHVNRLLLQMSSITTAPTMMSDLIAG